MDKIPPLQKKNSLTVGQAHILSKQMSGDSSPKILSTGASGQEDSPMSVPVISVQLKPQYDVEILDGDDSMDSDGSGNDVNVNDDELLNFQQ